MNSGSISFIYMQAANCSVLSIYGSERTGIKYPWCSSRLEFGCHHSSPLVVPAKNPPPFEWATTHSDTRGLGWATIHHCSGAKAKRTSVRQMIGDGTSCSPRRVPYSLKHIIDIVRFLDVCFVSLSISCFIKRIRMPYRRSGKSWSGGEEKQCQGEHNDGERGRIHCKDLFQKCRWSFENRLSVLSFDCFKDEVLSIQCWEEAQW